MNYGRIYCDFIASRMSVPPTCGEYMEKHHVVPRALGGTNDLGNLIRLTPEDHFFAHLLLAKIHGGKMWAPVAFMIGKERRTRRQHGWAARAMAEAKKGEGSYQFDKTLHKLVHSDGRQWSGLRADMQELGISLSLACMLLNGGVRSAKGWSLPGVVGGKARGTKHSQYNPDVITLLHVDGREAVGTRLELNERYGIPRSGLSRLLSGEAKVWNGWHKPGVKLPSVGRAGRWGAVQALSV